MRNFVVRDAIVPRLAATTREGVIRELIGALHLAGYFAEADLDEITRAILRREQLGSTGIGRNIAIPHSRWAGVERLVGTIGVSAPGVGFESIDNEPVYIVVLLVSPPDRPGDHLRALETTVRSMRDDQFVQALRAAETREAIWELILSRPDPWDRDRR